MIEIETVVGPLDDAGLEEVGRLYGRVDAKYGHLSYLRHLFVENPYGWAVHSFARDGAEAVAHCAAVPIKARVGGELVDSGKVEAYVVDERYRRGGERGSERPIALDVLRAVSDAAAERGIDPLHAYLTPRVGAIFERVGYVAQTTSARPYVLATDGRPAARAQRLLVSAVPSPPVRLEPVVSSPADPSKAGWTIAGEDSWGWFTASEAIHELELPGSRGGRALVLAGEEGEPVHLLAWKPKRETLRSAATLLAALARLARQRSAPTLRIQPWPGIGGEAALVRACRLLAFVPRSPFTIYTHSTRPDLPPVSPSPFFYATF